MRLFRRGPSQEAVADATRSAPADGTRPRVDVSVAAIVGDPYPLCSQCGRSQFPLVGDWEPPICLECDAQINEDTMQAEIDGR